MKDIEFLEEAKRLYVRESKEVKLNHSVVLGVKKSETEVIAVMILVGTQKEVEEAFKQHGKDN